MIRAIAVVPWGLTISWVWVAQAAPMTKAVSTELTLEEPMARLGTQASAESLESLCGVLRKDQISGERGPGVHLLDKQLDPIVTTSDGKIQRLHCHQNAGVPVAVLAGAEIDSTRTRPARISDSTSAVSAPITVSFEETAAPTVAAAPAAIARATPRPAPLSSRPTEPSSIRVREQNTPVHIQGSVLGVGASTVMYAPGAAVSASFQSSAVNSASFGQIAPSTGIRRLAAPSSFRSVTPSTGVRMTPTRCGR